MIFQMRKQIMRFLIIFLLANSTASFAMRLTQCYKHNTLPEVMAKMAGVKDPEYVPLACRRGINNSSSMQEAQRLLQVKRALETYRGGTKLTDLPDDVILHEIPRYFDDVETVKNVRLVNRYFKDVIKKKFDVVNESDYFYSPSLLRFLFRNSRIIKSVQQLEDLAEMLSFCKKIFIYKTPEQSFIIDNNGQNLFRFLYHRDIRRKYCDCNEVIVKTRRMLEKYTGVAIDIVAPFGFCLNLLGLAQVLFISSKYLTFLTPTARIVNAPLLIVVVSGFAAVMAKRKLERKATAEQREGELRTIREIGERYCTVTDDEPQ